MLFFLFLWPPPPRLPLLPPRPRPHPRTSLTALHRQVDERKTPFGQSSAGLPIKRAFWAVCNHCQAGMMGKVATLLAHAKVCVNFPEALKALYTKQKRKTPDSPGEAPPPPKAPNPPKANLQLKFEVTSRPPVGAAEQRELDLQLTRA